MIKVVQFLGFIMILQGITGAIAIAIDKPDFGVFFNFFNRHIVSRVGFLNGYELIADLVIAVLGVAVILVAEQQKKPA
jgi:hypothetical protein